MREAPNQHNIFIRTLVCRLTAICGPLRSCRLCARARTSSSSGTSPSPAHGPARQWPVASKSAPCAEQTSASPKAFKNRSGKVSSGKPKCGHRFTKPRNPSCVCQMMRSRQLVLCGSEITKPRVSSGATASAGQMTVPLGGSHRSVNWSGNWLGMG